jgi:hypothetical protein
MGPSFIAGYDLEALTSRITRGSTADIMDPRAGRILMADPVIDLGFGLANQIARANGARPCALLFSQTARL